MFFRGRENANKDHGMTKIHKLINELIQHGATLNSPLREKGSNVSAVLDPKKK
jgi:translation initiation factor IF-3